MFKKLSEAGINMGVLAISVVVFVGALCALTSFADSAKPVTITILAAARDMNMGDVITPNDLIERTVYEDENAELYIPAEEVNSVVGGVAALPLFAGQPVFRTSVLAQAAIPYRLSAILDQYPGYSLVPLPLDASNVIAPDVTMFLPGDMVGVTVVIAQRPSPPATQSPTGYFGGVQPTSTPYAMSIPPTPGETQKTSAIDRTAPPLAKDLFPNGVVVIMVQGAPTNTVSETSDSANSSDMDTTSSSAMFSGLGTDAMLLLLVPNDLREELSLAMQQGDQLVVSLMARGTEDTSTPGFTYWDFEALFKADRETVLEATPVP